MPTIRLIAAVLAAALVLAACGEDAAAPPEQPDAGDAVGQDGGGDLPAGTQLAAVSPQEARGFAEPTPVVVHGALYSDGDTWRICGALAESYPPQCAEHLVITNPDVLAEDMLASMESASGISWTAEPVTLSGARRGGDGLEVDPEAAESDDLIGGDAVDPGK